jgi:Fur family iron response transcriptional regulator
MSLMDHAFPAATILPRLRAAGLRPTRQRVALARLLFTGGDRHVTAEQLHGEAGAATIAVSLATVYNTLHQFTAVGLLREVVVEPGRSYFDTNIDDHHHFFCETTGMLQDIPGAAVSVGQLPAAPAGTEISRVDVIIRVRRQDRVACL